MLVVAEVGFYYARAFLEARLLISQMGNVQAVGGRSLARRFLRICVHRQLDNSANGIPTVTGLTQQG